jgi:hypothetical protein
MAKANSKDPRTIRYNPSKRGNEMGANEAEKGLPSEQTRGRYRMDLVGWSERDGRYRRIPGFSYSDSIESLVEMLRHPRKIGGFDRAVIYLLNADGSASVVENIHSVMGNLYFRGGVEFAHPTIDGDAAEPLKKKHAKKK